jgi:LL-diaminopimelate aminotransferase
MSTSSQSASVNLKPPATRLTSLPTYVFAELDRLKEAARQKGADLIDLGMGNPDQPVSERIIEAMRESLLDPANYGYPNFKGKESFRKAVVSWMSRRYQVNDLDPETDVQPLIGSKEGLAHLSFAYIDTGNYSIVPSPYYPVHSRATWIAGGQVHHLPLTEENGFLPDLSAIPEHVIQQAKLFFVNFPNNPTAATANYAFYEKLVGFCRQHGIVLVSDMAYGEIYYGDDAPLSILNIPGAKDVAVEFHSFSKSFNMAGFRVGFAVGNPEVIRALYAVKTNLDYGLSSVIQDGATYALNHAEEFLGDIVNTYRERRDLLVEGFQRLGWDIKPTKATMYLWLRVPKPFKSSKAWCEYLIDTAGVVITPGVAFGEEGEGFFRVSLVSNLKTLSAALERLEEKGIRYQS